MGSKSGLALFIVLSLNVLFGTAILLPDDGEHFIIDRVKRTYRITVRSFRPFISPSQNWSREHGNEHDCRCHYVALRTSERIRRDTASRAANVRL
jgi:hypothetical protein